MIGTLSNILCYRCHEPTEHSITYNHKTVTACCERCGSKMTIYRETFPFYLSPLCNGVNVDGRCGNPGECWVLFDDIAHLLCKGHLIWGKPRVDVVTL